MLERELAAHSDEWYVAQYLKYGSVEEVLKAYRYQVYLSEASYHRLVKKSGIVKSMGRREVSLTEALHFFARKALEPTVGIQTLYYQMPPSFQTSLASLHRIYNRILVQRPHRFATALILHSENDNKVLFGHEVRTQALQGKFRGDLSLPMTFCGAEESYSQAITRVLQQEVFTEQAIKQSRTLEISNSIEPFLKFTILDVEVRVFELAVPSDLLQQVNSYKLADYQLFDFAELQEYQRVRHGISEIVKAWRYGSINNLQSSLNQQLLLT